MTMLNYTGFPIHTLDGVPIPEGAEVPPRFKNNFSGVSYTVIGKQVKYRETEGGPLKSSSFEILTYDGRDYLIYINLHYYDGAFHSRAPKNDVYKKRIEGDVIFYDLSVPEMIKSVIDDHKQINRYLAHINWYLAQIANKIKVFK